MFRNGVLCCLAAAMLAGWAGVARANETDQFTLPVGKEFVDLGPYLGECHYQVLASVVEDLNKIITRALKIRDSVERKEQLISLHAAGTVADTVRGKFLPGFFDMIEIEESLKSGKAQKNFPGKVLLNEPLNWIYFYTHLPFDPRKIVLLFPSGTIKAYGVYFGTDKVGHFHDIGHFYYKSLLARRQSGMSEPEAVAQIVNDWSKGLLSEGGLIGNWATGVYSNGDLAANYLGFKFYRNLLEPTFVKGKERPPMLVRDGEFWKLNSHVGPDTDFFAPFISDHLNEALNPCVYEADIRWSVANRIRDLTPVILAVYADEHGRQRPREWFDNKIQELRTYYGEDYGHSRGKTNMLSIGDLCFPPKAEPAHQEP